MERQETPIQFVGVIDEPNELHENAIAKMRDWLGWIYPPSQVDRAQPKSEKFSAGRNEIHSHRLSTQSAVEYRSSEISFRNSHRCPPSPAKIQPLCMGRQRRHPVRSGAQIQRSLEKNRRGQ